MTELADRTSLATRAQPGELPQSRHLATELPGPRSRELMARKTSAVAGGVGTSVPVVAARAGGGIVEDVDGNRVIDLGSGIAVTSVGAKGVAGGMPLSAVVGCAELVDAVHTGGLGGTYGGNPVACAAALAALEAVERDGLLQRAREVQKVVKGRLHALAARDSRVGDVRGRGAMLAVELVGADGLTPDPALAAAVVGAAEAQGVIVLTCGTHGNVLRVLPPLSTSDEFLHDAFDVLDAPFAATSTTTTGAR